MCIDAPESTTNSRSSGLRFDGAGRHQFSEGEKNAAVFFSFNFMGCFQPASTLLHGHIALAILSLSETDPQILERWGCADEVHLSKSIRAKDCEEVVDLVDVVRLLDEHDKFHLVETR